MEFLYFSLQKYEENLKRQNKETTKIKLKTKMDNEEMEELFGPLRAAGWNPRWMDRSVVHYDNSVAAGYPTDIGDVYSDDLAAPHGEVNKAVGGAPTSNHLTGCAADIRVCGLEQLIRYATILLDISDESKEDFDELLLERNKAGRYWLHFAVRPADNRRKVALL